MKRLFKTTQPVTWVSSDLQNDIARFHLASRVRDQSFAVWQILFPSVRFVVLLYSLSIYMYMKHLSKMNLPLMRIGVCRTTICGLANLGSEASFYGVFTCELTNPVIPHAVCMYMLYYSCRAVHCWLSCLEFWWYFQKYRSDTYLFYSVIIWVQNSNYVYDLLYKSSKIRII